MPLQHAAQLRTRFLPSGELCRMQAYSVSPQIPRVTQPYGGPAYDLRFCTCIKPCMCIVYQIRAIHVRICGWVVTGLWAWVHNKQMAGLAPHCDLGLHQPAQPKAAWTAPA